MSGSMLLQCIIPTDRKGKPPIAFSIIMDAPPEALWERHVKERIQFYQRYEAVAPLRDWHIAYDPHADEAPRLVAKGPMSDGLWEAILGQQSIEDFEKMDEIIKKCLMTGKA